MDTIPELVWSALPDGGVEFCNQKWLGYTGMALDEVKGWGWTAAIHPQDILDLQERWRAFASGGNPATRRNAAVFRRNGTNGRTHAAATV